jgi:hypothetical protein
LKLKPAEDGNPEWGRETFAKRQEIHEFLREIDVASMRRVHMQWNN